MPTTLLTGENSFVAAHVIHALVEAGHDVVGTVRRDSAGQAVLALHPEWKGTLSTVVVEDIANQASWDEVFKSHKFDHVVHVAAPLLDDPANTDYDRDFLRPSVEGNLAILRSAQAHAPTLKSIVVTGSINAITTGSPDELKAGPGKKEAELAIWDFVKTSKPQFTVTVFLPALIFGPPIQPVKGGVKGLNYSARIIYSLFDGSNATVPPTTFPSYIDVRDLAAAHVKALTQPRVANKRLTIGGLPMTFTAMAHSLRKLPELEGRVAADSGEDANVVPAHIVADEATAALGLTFRSLDETVADAARRYLELEKET